MVLPAELVKAADRGADFCDGLTVDTGVESAAVDNVTCRVAADAAASA